MKGNYATKMQKDDLCQKCLAFIWAHLTVFSMLKQEDVCKHAKWMLNVSGMFFIVSGVS